MCKKWISYFQHFLLSNLKMSPTWKEYFSQHGVNNKLKKGSTQYSHYTLWTFITRGQCTQWQQTREKLFTMPTVWYVKHLSLQWPLLFSAVLHVKVTKSKIKHISRRLNPLCEHNTWCCFITTSVSRSSDWHSFFSIHNVTSCLTHFPNV